MLPGLHQRDLELPKAPVLPSAQTCTLCNGVTPRAGQGCSGQSRTVTPAASQASSRATSAHPSKHPSSRHTSPSRAGVLNIVEQISLAGRKGCRAVIHPSLLPTEGISEDYCVFYPNLLSFHSWEATFQWAERVFPCHSSASLLASPVFC